MRVLALDTTTREGSVALVDNGRVIDEREGDPARSHAERLPGDLTRALEAAGWPSSSVDVFAVVAGPGSFTGLRIGIATMQGLAFVHKRQVVAVSSLEALAHAASIGQAPGAMIGAWVDAHRSEVFSALYTVADAAPFVPERLVEIDPASAGPPAAVLARWDSLGAHVDLLVGDGARLYASLLEPEARSVKPEDSSPKPATLAGSAALIAMWRASRGGGVDPAALHPIYVRRPDVEVARDRERGAR